MTGRRLLIGLLTLLSAGGCSRCDRGSGSEVHIVARALSDTATFVQLPRGRDAGELSLLPITDGTWVEGRLHDKTVTGVVFADASYEETSFERVVSAFVERNTTNPASPPEVTCTLPVLDSVK